MKKNYFKILLAFICIFMLLAITACSSGAGDAGLDQGGDAIDQSTSIEEESTDSVTSDGAGGNNFWSQTGADGSLTFTTEDIEGNAVTSEDYKDARLILVNYWEPWCGPCVMEMPDLEDLYEKYKDQGFLVL